MNATRAYLQSEPLLQSGTSELTNALMRLVQRLEINDRPGLTLSMDQVSAFAECMIDRFEPPPSTWATAWSELMRHCAALHGLAAGVLNDDSNALMQAQSTLQAALDCIAPLTEAYADLDPSFGH
jgi:hypothetical protein